MQGTHPRSAKRASIFTAASLMAASIVALTSTAAMAQHDHGVHPGKALPSITTTGTGEVQITPNRAWVSMSANATRPEVTTAQAEVDAVVGRFLALTDSLGIAREHVATAGQSVSPNYEWEQEPRKRTLTGYTVSRELRVDVRDLDDLGPLLHRALQTGVNSAGSPQFGHTDRGRFEREALAAATRDAEARAQTMAQALELQLGEVLSLSTEAAYAPQPRPMMRAMAMSDSEAAEQSYETGELTVTATVNAKFGITQ